MPATDGVSCCLTGKWILGSIVEQYVWVNRLGCICHWSMSWIAVSGEKDDCIHIFALTFYITYCLPQTMILSKIARWEVPLPCTMKAIYLSSVNEGTDPRFVKLEPVFRCSMLKCGGIQSFPLTVEWSTSHPHDYLLAGCHDGSVALWKFSARGSSEDTRPLLCFSADTVPIRTVAWAPTERSFDGLGSPSLKGAEKCDMESANVIVTAGHGGLKFWDIRDPFRPLWNLHPVPKFIYGLDWSRDPSCVILSFDDGGLRILSLVKTAYDVPATGRPFVGTKNGLHLSNCLSSAVWSVQVSRQTGISLILQYYL
ncbi:hypothetical protein Patl1_30048 [Pistacia atlantica]|uniref:Uncharacterized protein n=1 Tax=Pistacia atlantica TaxID=434234 RepID=A0ACC1AAR0_9ROSI|nr:hypothetical protein Patl1_30048 [Pistacia atlantica]